MVLSVGDILQLSRLAADLYNKGEPLRQPNQHLILD